MLRIAFLLALAFGLRWFWQGSEAPEPVNSGAPTELREAINAKPEELEKAFRQATEALSKENEGAELFTGFPPELSDLLADPKSDPEILGSNLVALMRSLPENDYDTRRRVLRITELYTNIPNPLKVQISLRQLEVQSDPENPSDEELMLLEKAAEIQRQARNSPQELSQLYSELYILHPSAPAQAILTRFFLAGD